MCDSNPPPPPPPDFLACSPDEGAPLIVYVSKLFAMEKSDLPQHQNRWVAIMREREREREPDYLVAAGH